MSERVPRGEPVAKLVPHCPACGAPIGSWHSVPVVGWLVLGIRCAACQSRTSLRYPLMEWGTALLFAGVALRLDGLGLLSALPAYLYLAATGVVLAVIDFRHRRLPDAIVLPPYPVLGVLLAVSAARQGDWWALARAGIGGAGLFAFYLALACLPSGMGMGDVKLAGLLGAGLAYLSWTALTVGTLAGFLTGAAAGATLIAARRANRKTRMAYGPWMILGAFLAALLVDPARV